MSANSEDQAREKINAAVKKYKLWLVFPLIVCAAMALWKLEVGLAFLAFFIFVWVFGSLAWFLVQKLIPDGRLANREAELQQTTFITIFLGGSALIGEVLRGENAISDIVLERLPDEISIGFIDPVFALVCIVFLWVCAAYRVFR